MWVDRYMQTLITFLCTIILYLHQITCYQFSYLYTIANNSKYIFYARKLVQPNDAFWLALVGITCTTFSIHYCNNMVIC